MKNVKRQKQVKKMVEVKTITTQENVPKNKISLEKNQLINILNLIHNMHEGANIIFSKNGLRLILIDYGRIALVDLFISKKDKLFSFKCDFPTKIGITNEKRISGALELINSENVIIENIGDNVNITSYNDGKSFKIGFKNNLNPDQKINISKLREIKYNNEITLKKKDFFNILNYLSENTDKIKFEINNAFMKIFDYYDCEQKYSTKIKLFKPITKQVNYFTKTGFSISKLKLIEFFKSNSGNLKISFNSEIENEPLKISMKLLNGHSYLDLYIAPLITEEDDDFEDDVNISEEFECSSKILGEDGLELPQIKFCYNKEEKQIDIRIFCEECEEDIFGYIDCSRIDELIEELKTVKKTWKKQLKSENS